MTSSKVQNPIVPNRATMRTMEDFISLVKSKEESTFVQSSYYDVPHSMKEIFSVFDQNNSIMTTILSIVMEKDETILSLPQILCENLTSLTVLVDSDTRARDLLDISVLSTCSNLTELNIIGFPNLINVSSIGACQKLLKLDLSECSSLREIFFSLPELRELTLSGCTQLLSLHFLRHSMKLRVLDVSHCTQLLDILPVGREVLTVQKLDISYCTYIQTNYDTISSLKELSNFNCSHSKMAQQSSLSFQKSTEKTHNQMYSNNNYYSGTFADDLYKNISQIKRPAREEKKVVPSPKVKSGSSKEPIKIISKEVPSPKSSSKEKPLSSSTGKTSFIADDTPVIITGSSKRDFSKSPAPERVLSGAGSKPNTPTTIPLEQSSSSPMKTASTKVHDSSEEEEEEEEGGEEEGEDEEEDS